MKKPVKFLSKKEFLSAAKKGWRKVGFTTWCYYKTSTGSHTSRKDRACSACAIGAASIGLNVTTKKINEMLVVPFMMRLRE